MDCGRAAVGKVSSMANLTNHAFVQASPFGQENALKAIRVKVSLMPGRVWIFSVTK